MKFLIFFLGFVSLCYGENKCMFGPSYWCQDATTAKECGVSLFCKAMKTGKSTEKIQFHPKDISEKTTIKTKNTNDAAPVKVSFYYESLCPGCRGVWQQQLFPTYQALASSGIVEFEIVPYGNAQERQSGNKWQFYCQHGQAECYGNLIESCALHYYPEASQHIPFLHCLEYYGPTATNGKYCASLSNMTYSTIDTCVNGDLGNSLEHQMALKTEALNPPHQYVPWLNLNGQHTQAIQNGLSSNMLETVCNAYTGTKPAACSRMNRACYKGQ